MANEDIRGAHVLSSCEIVEGNGKGSQIMKKTRRGILAADGDLAVTVPALRLEMKFRVAVAKQGKANRLRLATGRSRERDDLKHQTIAGISKHEM